MIANFSYDEIKIGNHYSFKKSFSRDEVIQFSKLSGDINPLHIDEKFAKKSIFGRNIVHGMLISSLFSKIIGVHCPGERSLYLSQTLNFRKPLFINEEIIVKGEVIKKYDSLKIIEMKTEIIKNEEILVSGLAKVKVLEH